MNYFMYFFLITHLYSQEGPRLFCSLCSDLTCVLFTSVSIYISFFFLLCFHLLFLTWLCWKWSLALNASLETSIEMKWLVSSLRERLQSELVWLYTNSVIHWRCVLQGRSEEWIGKCWEEQQTWIDFMIERVHRRVDGSTRRLINVHDEWC